VTIRANLSTNREFRDGESFREHYGVTNIRGCEVSDIIGSDGKPIDEFTLFKSGNQLQLKYFSLFIKEEEGGGAKKE